MTFQSPIKTSDNPVDEANLLEKQALFNVCNAAIHRNFITIGANLRRIRDEDLWRYAVYPQPCPWKSFEEFCIDVHELSKGYVSRLISAASIALTMEIKAGIEIPTEPVASELKKVPEEKRVSILEDAAGKAIQAGRPLNSADIKLSRLEALGAIPFPVQKMAQNLDWAKDPDRMDVLLHWYQEGKDNPDSKFWAAYASGVLDPADGGKPVILRNASLREIHKLEQRWQRVVMEISKDDPAKQEWTGVIEVIDGNIFIDGQTVRIKGRKVKITVLE